jgi:hypothetical protein
VATKRFAYTSTLGYSAFSTAGGTTTTAAATALSDVAKIQFPGMERGKVDGTVLDSPSGAKEVVPLAGWLDSPDTDVEVMLTETQFAALVGLTNTGQDYVWVYTLPKISTQTTGAKLTVTAMVAKYTPPEAVAGADEPMKSTITLRRTTGLAVFTAGAAIMLALAGSIAAAVCRFLAA